MWFFVYAGLTGLSLASIFAIFKLGSIVQVFFISATMFGTTALYGYTTKKDLTGMGSFLMMGLIGVIIAGLVNIFLQSSMLQFIISLLSVVIFVGLTAWDVQQIKSIYYDTYGDDRERAGIMGALTLYLDFINIFVNLLQLVGERKD
jgi:FtsH-binding integral membrane protein